MNNLCIFKQYIVFINTTAKGTNIKLYSIHGKLVIEKENSNKISVDGLNAGKYILKATTASGKTLISKLIIK